ncbi:hypothetical protein A9Q79_00735 [Methylophaga sp. 42_25_T18]|nr:hypothetical protein A9Q79_00735 [Methylophaga sp. 42_25_T18]
MSFKNVVTAISFVFPLTGCVHIESPPESWGEIQSNVEASGCNNISGKYSNAGTKPNGNKVYLATWLEPKLKKKNPKEERRFLADLFAAKTVELKLTENEYLTVSTRGYGISGNRSWTMRKTKCIEGVLTIQDDGDISGDNVAAVGLGSITIYRSEKHLVVNSHGFAGGIILLIPFVGYGSDWARFSVLDE